jgi:hypothetical protein
MTHGVHAGGISGQIFRVKKSCDYYRRTLPFVLNVVFKRGVTGSGVYHALKYGAWTDRLINGHSVREFISVDYPLTFTLDQACRRGQKKDETTTPNRIRKWSPTLLLTGRYPGCLRRSDGMRNFLDSMVVDKWSWKFAIINNALTKTSLCVK